MKTLLLLVACIVFSVQAEAVTLTIRAEPESDLPGLLPSLRIWVSNDGSEAVEVPAKAALQVIPPRGEPFIAYSGFRGDDRVMLLAERPFTLAPGEMRDLSFWSAENWFSSDDRFETTGRFRLQLVIDAGLDSTRLDAVSRIVDQPGLVQPLVSNETMFTAREPSGDDLAVWNLLKANRGYCTPELTGIIWSRYPDSRYAAYCVPHLNDSDEMKRIAGHEAALAKGPRPAFAEGYRINIANAWLSHASRLSTTDVEQAVEAYNRARTILEPLSKNALAPEHREMAAEMLLRTLTRKDIVRAYNSAHGVEEKYVRIGALCFQKLPDGRHKVWFGYDNNTMEPIPVPIGNENKFTPPPFDRKQPTTFARGTHKFDFFVITKDPVLVWHLQKETAQFKLNETIECPPWFDPKNRETWTLEEP